MRQPFPVSIRKSGSRPSSTATSVALMATGALGGSQGCGALGGHPGAGGGGRQTYRHRETEAGERKGEEKS